MNRRTLAFASLFLILIISCDRKNTDSLTPTSPDKPNTELDIRESSGIVLVDQMGLPISNARVLIGPQMTTENPWLQVAESGLLSLPETWTSNQDLTIEAPGYVRLTLKQQPPLPLTLTLKKSSQVPDKTVKGLATGIKTKDKDGLVDFAIVLDSLTKNEVLNFNINKVISPYTETMSVFGFEFPIPQNIFLPKQKENYFIGITLQKPWFNLIYDDFGSKSIYTLRGQFPLKKVLGELQDKKPYYELVNYFDFSSAGRLDFDLMTQLTTIKINEPKIDTNQIILDRSYTVTAPTVDAKQVVLGISAFKEKQFYQPLDVKYLQSQETKTFKSSPTTTPFFIGVLKNKDEFSGDSAGAERMSVSIDLPKSTVSYLPLTQDPLWNSPTELGVDLPSMVDSGFSEQGMVVVVSELKIIQLPDGSQLKYKLPIWEVHSARWSSTIQIPDLGPTNTQPKRVEVTLLATQLDNSGQQNPVTLIFNHEERVESATHFTKSARDY